MRHPEWPDIILGLFLVTMALIVGVATGSQRAYAQPEAIPALQVSSDEGQALALERAVNAIRVNTYNQPARTPSSKLRSTARFWNVTYTALAADVESTKLYNLVLDTLKVAEFNPFPAFHYAVYDEPVQHSPDAIVQAWRVSVSAPFIFGRPELAHMGCAYRNADGRTRAFCIFADTMDEQPTAMPLQLTPRPLSTPTPRWWR